MTVFYDNFERANGPPGGNWVLDQDTPAITGGLIDSPNWYVMHDTTTGSATKIEATAHLYYHYTVNQPHGPIVKVTAGAFLGYYCFLYPSGGNHYFTLGRGHFNNKIPLATVQVSPAPPPYNELYIKWDQGHLTATLNGEYLLEADDALYAGNQYAGLTGQYAYMHIADIRIITDGAGTLSINPEVIGNYGACTEVTLTGIGTNWTPGTPGSPTFTVNHGTISAQTVNSATSATLTYCPGTYLGTITFTDPSTGLTVGALVTSDPALVPPTGMQLSQTAIDYIERSAVAQASPTILNQDATNTVQGLQLDVLGTYGKLRLLLGTSTYTLSDESETDMATQVIWDILTHREPAGADASFRDVLAQLLTDTTDLLLRWKVGETSGLWKVDEVLDILGGISHKSHVDILDAIDAIEGGSNEDVLDALEALRGDEVSTVKAIQDHLIALRTVENYVLTDVKTWTEAVRGSGLPTVKGVLDAVNGLSFASQSSVNTAISDVAGVASQVTGVNSAVSALSTFLGEEVALILEAITAIADAIAALAVSGPPVWPGADGVDLGTPADLVDQLYLVAPMDGVIVAVTTPPTKTGRRSIGGATYDYGVGEIAFETDSGDLEPWQYLGFRAAIFTPKTMEHAAGARFRVLAGALGTVTPWTRS
jgi:hypothetical protein